MVVGGSGVGKDTVMRHARPLLPQARFVRRVITRPAEPNEDHEPMTASEFARRDADGGFAVTWEAHDLRYAVPRVACAGVAIVNGSRRALDRIEAAFARIAVVEITASAGTRAERLRRRGREGDAEIARRVAREAPVPARFRPLRIANEGTPQEAARAFADAVHALFPTNREPAATRSR